MAHPRALTPGISASVDVFIIERIVVLHRHARPNQSALFLSLVGTLLLSPPPLGAQWSQTAGPYGGSITALTADTSHVFLGTAGAGVYSSTNNGTQWNEVNNGLPPYAFVTSLKAIGANLFAGVSGKGILLSSNSGSSWVVSDSALKNTAVRAFAVNGSALLAGTDAGIYITTNSGGSWSSANTGLTVPYVYSIQTEGSFIVAGTNGGGVYLSTNSGGTWTRSNNGLSVPYISTLAVLGTDIFAGTSGGGVYRSTNNGSSWTTRNAGLFNLDVTTLLAYNSSLLAGTSGGGIFTSSDGGTNWNQANTGLSGNSIMSLISSGSNIYAGTNLTGLFLSTNGGSSWTPANGGITNSSVTALGLIDTLVVAGTCGGNLFRTTDKGLNWADLSSGLRFNTPINAVVSIGASWFVSAAIGGVFKSTNAGSGWSAANSGLPDGINVHALSTHGATLFAGSDQGVFRSLNLGGSWSQMSNGLAGTSVLALAYVDPALLAGTDAGIYRSTDDGASWAFSNAGLSQNTRVSALVKSGPNILAATAAEGVYFSTDSGVDWTNGNAGLPPNVLVYSFASNDTIVFAGTDHGAYYSFTGDMNWMPVLAGFQRIIPASAVTLRGQDVFAGTAFAGVWKRNITDLEAQVTLTVNTPVSAGWNLVSVPLRVGNAQKSSLFPRALSNAFDYENGYRVQSIMHAGPGYWLKFSIAGSNSITGAEINGRSISVAHGWNLIGSISHPVAATSIVPFGTSIGSPFITFSGAYQLADSIRPGRGYWVRVDSPGSLLLSDAGSNPPATERRSRGNGLVVDNAFTFSDGDGHQQTLYLRESESPEFPDEYYGLPPVPPPGAFDVRFATQRMAESPDGMVSKTTPISIASESYPVSISWRIGSRSIRGELEIGGNRLPLTKTGSSCVTDRRTRVAITLAPSRGVPRVFSLEQNYPNPFNPSTTVRFALPVPGMVLLRVYNVLGDVVTTLVSGERPSGSYAVTWDASNAASGLYFYRLSAGKFDETKKMLLVR